MSLGARFPLARAARAQRTFQLAKMLEISQRSDVISLALGLPDRDLFPAAELAALADDLLRRSPTTLQYQFSLLLLKKQVVELLARRGIACEPQQVLLTHGTSQAIDLVLRLLVDPGQTVAAEAVTYEGFVAAARSLDLSIETLPYQVANGFDLEALENRLLGGWRPALLYAVPTGHNPLGVSLDRAARERLCELGRRFAIPILEDDAYGFLDYSPDPPPALAAIEPAGVFHTGSFSKILAPGLRLAWLVVPPEYASVALELKRAADLNAADFAQHLVCAFLATGELAEHLARVRTVYGRRCQLAIDTLEAHLPSAVRWSRPTAGMFAWLELPPEHDTTQLLDQAVDIESVAFSPGQIFATCPQGPPAHSLRLCFVSHPDERLQEALVRLARVISQQVALGPPGPTVGGEADAEPSQH